MPHYIKNGKRFFSKEPIYWFEWVYGTGKTTFGLHGTQAEYDLDCDCDTYPEPRRLINKVPVPETAPPFA